MSEEEFLIETKNNVQLTVRVHDNLKIAVYSDCIEECKAQPLYDLFPTVSHPLVAINPHDAFQFSKEHTIDTARAIAGYCKSLFTPFADGDYLEYNEYTVKAIIDFVNRLVVPIPRLQEDKDLPIWKYVTVETYETLANKLKTNPCDRHASIVIVELASVLEEFFRNEPKESMVPFVPKGRSIKTIFAIRKNKKELAPLFKMIRALIKDTVSHVELCKEEKQDDTIEVSLAHYFLKHAYAYLNHDNNA